MKYKNLVFIHGLFMNPTCWKDWIVFFESKGYTCYAPAYPFHEGDVRELQSKNDIGLQDLTFGQVVNSLRSFINKLDEKPIVIGHSMGGLAVQKLVELDSCVAGICIEPAPPRGVLSFDFSFVKAHLPTVNPIKGNSVCMPSVEWVQYAICNTMELEDVAQFYGKFIVPESRNVPRSSIGVDGKIDFTKAHNPLLFIGGEKDNSIPSSLVMKNMNAYKENNSKRDFREFAGRTHAICLQENWVEVANFVFEWINELDEE